MSTFELLLCFSQPGMILQQQSTPATPQQAHQQQPIAQAVQYYPSPATVRYMYPASSEQQQQQQQTVMYGTQYQATPQPAQPTAYQTPGKCSPPTIYAGKI